eukprot:gene18924-20828_t
MSAGPTQNSGHVVPAKPVSTYLSRAPLQTVEKRVWSTEEGEMLLDMYEANKDRFKDPSVRKMGIWREICQAINQRFNADFTPERCHQKLRNFKNDFQKVIMLEKRDCRHFDRLHKIFLKSLDKPLQSPAALKRRLTQLARPTTKSKGQKADVPEKKRRTVFPGFKSKTGTSVVPSETQGAHSSNFKQPAAAATQMRNPKNKGSTGRNPQPEQTTVQISPRNSTVTTMAPVFMRAEQPVNEERTSIQLKASGYESISGEHTLVSYPHTLSKPHVAEAAIGKARRESVDGVVNNVVTQAPVVHDIRSSDGIPGNRMNAPKDRQQSTVTVYKVEDDDDNDDDVYSVDAREQSQVSGVPKTTADGTRLAQDQTNMVHVSQQLYTTSRDSNLAREQIYVVSQPNASRYCIVDRVVNTAIAQESGDGSQSRKVYQLQQSGGISSYEAGTVDRRANDVIIAPKSRSSDVVEIQGQERRSADNISVSQNVIMTGQKISNEATHGSTVTLMPVSACFAPAQKGPPPSEVISQNHPVIEAVGRVHEPQSWREYDYASQQQQQLQQQQQVQQQQQQQRVYSYDKAHSTESSIVHDRETKSTDGCGSRNVLDLTGVGEYRNEQLGRIADGIDKWRQECREREEARVKREIARDKRIEEMHQETRNMTIKFVQLFENFVTKVGDAGDQMY